MFKSIYDFADFYKHPMGQVAQTILRAAITNFIGNEAGLRVVGIGYTEPYLDLCLPKAERCIAITPARFGAVPWPDETQNLVAVSEEDALPLETNSVDRIILVHAVEYAESLPANLAEIWRVLKGNGRLLIVTPNRMGFWARAVWSPFGHGSPSTLDQLRFQLREQKFIYERHAGALYTPPLRWRWVQRAYKTFETCGPFLCPALSGVHVVEASKQIYAGVDSGGGTKARAQKRVNINPTPAPLRFKNGVE